MVLSISYIVRWNLVYRFESLSQQGLVRVSLRETRLYKFDDDACQISMCEDCSHRNSEGTVEGTHGHSLDSRWKSSIPHQAHGSHAPKPKLIIPVWDVYLIRMRGVRRFETSLLSRGVGSSLVQEEV
jgi:hypothetical protein